MSATYTWDVFCTVDGYGSLGPGSDWGGYWGKQGPELLAHRAAQMAVPQRVVLGATTFRENAAIMAAGDDPNALDTWYARLTAMPTTVFSSTLDDDLGWPDATIVRGDAVEEVARLKQTSPVPLRSQASLSLNHALLGAGLVDRVQLTVFPAVTARTGTSPVLAGAGELDLELLETHVLDGRTLELVYRPSVHPSARQGSGGPT